MASIYDITFSGLWEQVLPSQKRLATWLAMGAVLLSPLQWLRDNFFARYADGSSDAVYSSVTAYLPGDRVIYTDRAVYECLLASTGNNPSDTTYWIKIQDVFIGLRERSHYNSQKIVLEYALNRWFSVTSAPLIYIDNNALVNNAMLVGIDEPETSTIAINENESLDAVGLTASNNGTAFTIWVPTAVWNTIAASDPDRTSIIKSFADQFVLAGITYDCDNY